jgi:hypothetical protein
LISGSNAARGLNKEKTQKLDEYKAKRLAKGDKKRVRYFYLEACMFLTSAEENKFS